jgi:hypothetical protein
VTSPPLSADSELTAGEPRSHGSYGFRGHREEGLLEYHGFDGLGCRKGKDWTEEGGGVLGLARLIFVKVAVQIFVSLLFKFSIESKKT